MTPSRLHIQYRVGDSYTLFAKFCCQFDMHPWPPPQLSHSVLTLRKVLHRCCFSDAGLTNYSWVFIPSQPAPIVPRFYSHGLLIHHTSGPAGVFDRLSNFPLKPYKPGLHHLHFSQCLFLWNYHRISRLFLITQWLFWPRVANVSTPPPKKTWWGSLHQQSTFGTNFYSGLLFYCYDNCNATWGRNNLFQFVGYSPLSR